MLSFRGIPRGISHFLKQSTQQLHTSIKVLASKDPQDSSSSSSDSSDSDSDKEDNLIKRLSTQAKSENDAPKISDTNERLNALLLSIEKAASKKKEAASTSSSTATSASLNTKDTAFEKNIKVSIKSRKERLIKKKVEQAVQEKPYVEQLKTAAKQVAETLKGDSSVTELELLSQVLETKTSSAKQDDDSTEKKIDSPASMELSSLLSIMKVDQFNPANELENKRRARAAQMFSNQAQNVSLSESVLHAKSQESRYTRPTGPELAFPKKRLGIFAELSSQQTADIPQLSTWNKMEAREMELSVLFYPENYFQELIQWTERGKLWHFPINNEQGMEEEEKIHFSEHIFMERHLEDWCPKKGPIRHFMELVCVGLSKNPYMSVEEKVGHITWYKDYFESKHDLLQDLGVLDEKVKVASDEKKEIQA